MKTPEPSPEYAGSANNYWIYEDLIRSMEIETLFEREWGDYHGDTASIVKGLDGRYGLLQYGWGSCSGCDALEAAVGPGPCTGTSPETIVAVTELRDEIYSQIHWEDTAAELAEWLKTRDWQGQYYYNEDDLDEFLSGALETLEGEK